MHRILIWFVIAAIWSVVGCDAFPIVKHHYSERGEEEINSDSDGGDEDINNESITNENTDSDDYASDPEPLDLPESYDKPEIENVEKDMNDGEIETALTWVTIPEGTFIMGCAPADMNCFNYEQPTHFVSYKYFMMTQTEITQDQYYALMGEKPGFNPSCGGDCPVVQVDWEAAKAFCEAAGGRLPSEAEWEYAARGGKTTTYYCGSSASCLNNIAWYGDDSSGATARPVKGKNPNAYGLYDMLGNVAEWTEDCEHDDYSAAPTDGSVWSGGNCNARMIRGGSFNSSAQWLRAAARDWGAPYIMASQIGFRCAKDLHTDGDIEEGDSEKETVGDVEREEFTVETEMEITEQDVSEGDIQAVINWVTIPGGVFFMGCHSGETCEPSELPAHYVTVKSFKMTQTEITVNQMKAVTGYAISGYCVNPQSGDCPAEYQNNNFCELIGGRLPSEAEWEYAMRAGTDTIYYCGDDDACADEIGWWSGNSAGKSQLVAQKKPNNFGLYDMAGNLWEPVADCWNYSYEGAPTDGSPWYTPSCSNHVIRGGAYYNLILGYFYSSHRGMSGDIMTGLRCVKN